MFPSHSHWQDASRPQQITDGDLQTLVNLASKYGSVNLMFFLRSLGEPSRMSTVSQMTLSSNSSSIPSLSWSTSEPSMCHSETASIMSQTTQATWSESTEMGYLPTEVAAIPDPSWAGSPATPHPTREKGESAMSLALAAAAAASSNTSSQAAGRKAIECTMCFVEGIVVGFSRKSDFKKHLQNFHHTNTLWMCQYAGCPMTFDFEKAYTAHVKAYHTDMHLPPSRARVEMCPQLVFACGFRGCKDRVFEAKSEEEASTLRDKYFDHVAKHFDMGFCVAEWEYYTQVHNLLRQESVKDMWKQCVWQKGVRNSLRWQPRAAADLKRLLECRHIGDLPRLLHWAWTLGGDAFNNLNCDAPEIPPGLSRPLKKDCPLSASNHEAIMTPALTQQYYQEQAQQQQQQQQAQQQQQQSFQFSIAHPKPPPPQGIFLPDTRRATASGGAPAKQQQGAPQQQHDLGRHAFSEPEGWPHPHPGTPYSVPDTNATTRWQHTDTDEDYNFGPAGSTDHMPSAAPSEQVDHPMGGVPPTEMHHSMPHRHQHEQPPTPLPSQQGSHQWATTAPMGGYAMEEGRFEDGTRPRTPKRPISLARKSVDNLRLKRRGPSGTEPEDVPRLPGMVPPGFDLPMRTGQMTSPTFYHEEAAGA